MIEPRFKTAEEYVDPRMRQVQEEFTAYDDDARDTDSFDEVREPVDISVTVDQPVVHQDFFEEQAQMPGGPSVAQKAEAEEIERVLEGGNQRGFVQRVIEPSDRSLYSISRRSSSRTSSSLSSSSSSSTSSLSSQGEWYPLSLSDYERRRMYEDQEAAAYDRYQHQ